uniref:Uncharacterized protein n=1 Tax=Arundo donax TaxID=35708 RepID=A0A0A9EQ97_ARUDO
MEWLRAGGIQASPLMAGFIQLIVAMAVSLEFIIEIQDHGQDS